MGWLTNKEGHLIDRKGKKKLDVKQMEPNGDLPLLYTYKAQRFDILDCMGDMEKDGNGKIVLRKD